MLRLVLCNCTPEEADGLAEALVSRQLAACVNVIPRVKSFYVWDGAMQVDEESTLLIKTTSERYPALKAALEELHSYTTPEIVAFDSVDVLSSYLTWAIAQTGGTP